MPFLAPFIPLIIKGGIAAGAGFLGKKLVGGNKGTTGAGTTPDSLAATFPGQEAAAGRIGESAGRVGEMAEKIGGPADMLGGIGNFAQRMGRKQTRSGYGALTDVMNYYRPLLSGNRQAMGELLAPEINAVSGQYDASKRNIAEFGPRGGGSNTAIGNLETGKAQTIGDMYFKARPFAAQGMTQVGGMMTGAGTANLGVGAGALEGQGGLYGLQGNLYGTQGGLFGSQAGALNNISRLILAQQELANQEKARKSGLWGDLIGGIGSIVGGYLGGRGK